MKKIHENRNEYLKNYRKQNKEKMKEYCKIWYQKNKEKVLKKTHDYYINNINKKTQYYKKYREETEYNKKYYAKNKEQLLKNNSEYYKNNKEILALKNKQWRENNQDKIQKYNEENRMKRRLQAKEYRLKNKEKIKAYRKEFESRPERIAYRKKWNRENPKSRCSSYPLELEISMNNVRKRDNNTCQWYGCGLKAREGIPIDVHHIFPRSEYPELELVEEYMLCYCLNHHVMFHKYRGDQVWQFLAASRKQEDPLQEKLD